MVITDQVWLAHEVVLDLSRLADEVDRRGDSDLLLTDVYLPLINFIRLVLRLYV